MVRKAALKAENILIKAQLLEYKSEIARLRAEYNEEIARLREQGKTETERLQKQIEVLQEALFSKTAPMAYMDLKADKAAAKENALLTPEEIQARKEEIEVYKAVARESEKPLFDPDEDIVDQLMEMNLGPVPLGGEPLHDNSES